MVLKAKNHVVLSQFYQKSLCKRGGLPTDSPFKITNATKFIEVKNGVKSEKSCGFIAV
jgi:hypothetical protein